MPCVQEECTIPVTSIYVLDQNNQWILQQVISCSINSKFFCKYFQAMHACKVRYYIMRTIIVTLKEIQKRIKSNV